MKIGVCGIACEKYPLMLAATCPNYPQGCLPKENKFCQIAACAFAKGMQLCFTCAEFPCATTKTGPIAFGYCQYISGKS